MSIKCIAIFHETLLIGVWTFVIDSRSLSSVAYPLGSGMHTEFGGPLLDLAYDTAELYRILHAISLQLADRLYVFNIRAGGPLASLCKSSSTLFAQDVVDNHFISMDEAGSWDAYFANMSKSMRRSLRYDNKKLGALGKLDFALLEDPSEIARMYDWMIVSKRAWLKRVGYHSDWLNDDRICAFFRALLVQPPAKLGRLAICALTLDGRPLACGMFLIDATTCEYCVTTYDPEFHAYSPGSLLTFFSAQWALERGLNFDFCQITYPYKERWAKRKYARTTFRIATRWKGIPTIAALILDGWYKKLKLAAKASIRKGRHALHEAHRRSG